MAVARRLVTRLGPLSVIDAVKHHGAPVLERICVDFPAVAQAGFLLFGKLVLDGRCRAEKASAVDMAVLLNRVDHLRILLGHGALITIGPLAGPHQGPVPTLHLVLDFCHVSGFSPNRGKPSYDLVDVIINMGGAHPNTRNSAGQTVVEAWLRTAHPGVSPSALMALIDNGACVHGASLLWACANHPAWLDAVVAALDPAVLAGIINDLSFYRRPRAYPVKEITGITRAAASNNEYDQLRFLSLGADLHVCGPLGVTALYAACENLHADMVSLLLRHGADPNAGAASLPNMLDRANGGGSVYDKTDAETAVVLHDIVRLMIAAGADVNRADEKGATALALASYYGHEKIVATLIGAGADVNQLSSHSLWNGPCTALRATCQSYPINRGVLSLLIVASAKLTKSHLPPPNMMPVRPVLTDLLLSIEQFHENTLAHGPSAPVALPCLEDMKLIVALLCVADPDGTALDDAVKMYDNEGVFVGDMLGQHMDVDGNEVRGRVTPATMAQMHDLPALSGFITANIGLGPCAALAREPIFEPTLRAVLGTLPLPVSALRGAAGLSPIAAAALRWAPSRHWLFCAEHRAMAKTVLEVARCGNKWGVPLEVWLLIIALVGRDAFHRPA